MSIRRIGSGRDVKLLCRSPAVAQRHQWFVVFVLTLIQVRSIKLAPMNIVVEPHVPQASGINVVCRCHFILKLRSPTIHIVLILRIQFSIRCLLVFKRERSIVKNRIIRLTVFGHLSVFRIRPCEKTSCILFVVRWNSLLIPTR